MKSVFSTPPPSFSHKELFEIINEHFSCTGIIKDLYSDRDQNILIQLDNGKKAILKISNPAEDLNILNMQHAATQYIRNKDSRIQVPMQIGKIVKIQIRNQFYFMRILNFIEGEFLKDLILNDNDYSALGLFMGRLSNALDGFTDSAADRKFEWDIRRLDLVKARLNVIRSKNKRIMIHNFLNNFEEKYIKKIQFLRMAIIHNDSNDHNILINKSDNNMGIIDFGDMVLSYQVAEIAVCMTYIALTKDNPFIPMAQVLKGYHSSFPLSDLEIKCIIYLICIRLSISVTMSSWRNTLFPQNEYLLTSQKPAWTLLEKLDDENLEEWSEKFLEYIK
tara:strand:- start:1899 stop:2900 length:1002 start_codon:yes stop_codon:yes gene_type:complete